MQGSASQRVMVLATVTDPQGRIVELTAERWGHVLDIHPEVKPFRAEILRAIETRGKQMPGRKANEQWFYLAAGPSRWLKVVVAYERERGWIVTAFGRRSLP
jgi:hypothetical protein